MAKLLLITLAFVAIAVALLALKLLLKGDSRGPMTHIGASKAMRQLHFAAQTACSRAHPNYELLTKQSYIKK